MTSLSFSEHSFPEKPDYSKLPLEDDMTGQLMCHVKFVQANQRTETSGLESKSCDGWRGLTEDRTVIIFVDYS